MKIAFIGDIHGSWRGLNAALDTIKTDVDEIIQVGDFGYWPGNIHNLEKSNGFSRPIRFIDGNHEHFEFLKAATSKKADSTKPEPIELPGNIIYMPRGSTLTWDGIKFGFLGGGWSIDYKMRSPGHDWFPKYEVALQEEADLIPKDVDFMVTHDCPIKAMKAMNLPDPRIFGVTEEEIDHTSQNRMQSVLERIKPTWWVHGHYHLQYDTELEGCKILGLNEVRIMEKLHEAFCVFDTEKREFIERP